MNKKASKQECIDSVKNRAVELQKALDKPSDACQKILKACKSQVALSMLHYPERGITSMARNTMYKYSNILFSGQLTPDGKSGYNYLDWLRTEVLRKVTVRSKSRTVSSRMEKSKNDTEDLKSKLYATEEATLAIEKAYWDLFKSIRNEMNAEYLDEKTRDRLANLINHHAETYHDIFAAENKEDLVAKVKKITQ